MWSMEAGSAASGLRAQLLLAFVLLAVFPILLLNIPLRTDSVTLELGFDSGDAGGGAATVTGQQVRPVRRLRPVPPGAIVEPRFWPSLAGRGHRLELTAANALVLDGRRVDPAALQVALDALALTDGEWLELRPEPSSRSELFHQVLAAIARAGLDRLRLDNRRFAGAIDADRDPDPYVSI